MQHGPSNICSKFEQPAVSEEYQKLREDEIKEGLLYALALGAGCLSGMNSISSQDVETYNLVSVSTYFEIKDHIAHMLFSALGKSASNSFLDYYNSKEPELIIEPKNATLIALLEKIYGIYRSASKDRSIMLLSHLTSKHQQEINLDNPLARNQVNSFLTHCLNCYHKLATSVSKSEFPISTFDDQIIRQILTPLRNLQRHEQMHIPQTLPYTIKDDFMLVITLKHVKRSYVDLDMCLQMFDLKPLYSLAITGVDFKQDHYNIIRELLRQLKYTELDLVKISIQPLQVPAFSVRNNYDQEKTRQACAEYMQQVQVRSEQIKFILAVQAHLKSMPFLKRGLVLTMSDKKIPLNAEEKMAWDKNVRQYLFMFAQSTIPRPIPKTSEEVEEVEEERGHLRNMPRQ